MQQQQQLGDMSQLTCPVQQPALSSASADISSQLTGLDRALHDLEFEAQQSMKLVNQRKQRLELLQQKIVNSQQALFKHRTRASHLDDQCKQLHRQFVRNNELARGFIASVSPMLEHHLRIEKEIGDLNTEVEKFTNENDGLIAHYRGVLSEREEFYNQFPGMEALNKMKLERDTKDVELRNYMERLTIVYEEKDNLEAEVNGLPDYLKGDRALTIKIAELKTSTICLSTEYEETERKIAAETELAASEPVVNVVTEMNVSSGVEPRQSLDTSPYFHTKSPEVVSAGVRPSKSRQIPLACPTPSKQAKLSLPFAELRFPDFSGAAETLPNIFTTTQSESLQRNSVLTSPVPVLANPASDLLSKPSTNRAVSTPVLPAPALSTPVPCIPAPIPPLRGSGSPRPLLPVSQLTLKPVQAVRRGGQAGQTQASSHVRHAPSEMSIPASPIVPSSARPVPPYSMSTAQRAIPSSPMSVRPIPPTLPATPSLPATPNLPTTPRVSYSDPTAKSPFTNSARAMHTLPKSVHVTMPTLSVPAQVSRRKFPNADHSNSPTSAKPSSSPSAPSEPATPRFSTPPSLSGHRFSAPRTAPSDPATPRFSASPSEIVEPTTPRFPAPPSLSVESITPRCSASPSFPTTPNFSASPSLPAQPATPRFSAPRTVASDPATPNFQVPPTNPAGQGFASSSCADPATSSSSVSLSNCSGSSSNNCDEASVRAGPSGKFKVPHPPRSAFIHMEQVDFYRQPTNFGDRETRFANSPNSSGSGEPSDDSASGFGGFGSGEPDSFAFGASFGGDDSSNDDFGFSFGGSEKSAGGSSFGFFGGGDTDDNAPMSFF